MIVWKGYSFRRCRWYFRIDWQTQTNRGLI